MESRRRVQQKRTCESISKVESVTKKFTEKRITCYGHVKKRDEGHVLRLRRM